MRFLLTLLLICILFAMPVSAVAVNPVSVPGVARISLSPQPADTMPPVKTITPVTTAVPVSVRLIVNSDPQGATVVLNGWVSEMKTPVTVYLTPGSQTIRLTLHGYKDYTTTVILQEGHPAAINAQLEPGSNLMVSRQNVSALKTLDTEHTINRDSIPGVIPTEEIFTGCSVSPQKCLTLAEAAALYPQGYSYTEGEPVCGYAVSENNKSMPKYCISGSPPSGILPGRVPVAVVVSTGVPGNVVNASRNMSMETQKADGISRVLGAKRQVGVFESVLGFFNGLFNKPPVCPQGKTACGRECVDLLTHSSHCGSCDFVCFEPGVCEAGECVEDSFPRPNPVGDIIL